MPVKNVLNPPPFAPGFNVADFLNMGLYAVESSEIAYGDTSPVDLFNVPANTLVVGAICEITEAWDGTGAALEFGDGDASTRLMAATDITEATLGFYSKFQAHKYTAGDTLIATITPGSGASAGKAKFWIIYRPLSNKQEVG